MKRVNSYIIFSLLCFISCGVLAQSEPLEISVSKTELNANQKERLSKVHETTRLVNGTTLEHLIERHQGLDDVDKSIALLEEVVRVYTEYCDSNCRNLLYRKEAYRLLYMRTGLPTLKVVEFSDPNLFSAAQVQEMLGAFRLPHKEGVLWTEL